ncbi:hypothetical protein [Novosphingobium mangrovi (ex Hu et al. 2023)]|uniref:Uncharacterized protein n=1 Tax=Novosphingobium mangrovi (ex Hu et al. 2023) TaxID=2930094 RepID=A0ABT0A9M3_9SPHN|nr:hypothetical protein [Novosphingobium mangrovi (ex Hu et al. 2023)]MCJ1959895.1 hypothetical protein [Novosphingobium mangrovi (ex Hu et al. 2023)]
MFRPTDTSEQPNSAAEVATPGKTPKVVRLRLENVNDVQRALARLIRGTLAGKYKTEDLSRYANAFSILARLMEGGDLEKRLAALEAGER